MSPHQASSVSGPHPPPSLNCLSHPSSGLTTIGVRSASETVSKIRLGGSYGEWGRCQETLDVRFRIMAGVRVKI